MTSRRVGRRRRAHFEAPSEERKQAHWGPKWRRLVSPTGLAPLDYTEFDRTVRGMLNRVTTENASRLLPLEPSLRGAGAAADDCDSPPWWAARFAAHMLSSYIRVVHTNRCARGLAMRSMDNVLPEYLDAMSPLLIRSPRLVTALVAWFGRLLGWQDMTWSAARLLLLASREERDRDTLPLHSLGRLPPELVSGRILSFLMPPALPRVGQSTLASCTVCSDGKAESPDEQRDVIAVLAHLLLFASPAIWPRLASFAFALAGLALAERPEPGEDQVYLAASLLVTIAQRLEHRALWEGRDQEEARQVLAQDLGPLLRLANRLEAVVDRHSSSGGLSKFVSSKAGAALEYARRVQDQAEELLAVPCPAAPTP